MRSRLTPVGARPRAISSKPGHRRPSDHDRTRAEFHAELTAGCT